MNKLLALLSLINLSVAINASEIMTDTIREDYLYVIYAYGELNIKDGSSVSTSGVCVRPTGALANATYYSTVDWVNPCGGTTIGANVTTSTVEVFGLDATSVKSATYRLYHKTTQINDSCAVGFIANYTYGGNHLKEDTKLYDRPEVAGQYITSVTVHPFFKVSPSNKFIKEGENLRVSIGKKTQDYLNYESENYTRTTGRCAPESDQIRYNFELQVSDNAGKDWVTLDLNLYDYSGNLNIPFNKLIQAFGNEDFVGKECYIRTKQFFDNAYLGYHFVSEKVPFYYFPALEFVDINFNNPNCPQYPGVVSYKIGNLPAERADHEFQYLYLLYKYDENYPPANLTGLRDEDKFETLYSSNGSKTVYFRRSINAGNVTGVSSESHYHTISQGIYKLKVYLLVGADSEDAEFYYPADTVFEIKSNNDVITVNIEPKETGWGNYEVPTGESEGEIVANIEGGSGNYYYSFSQNTSFPSKLEFPSTGNTITAPYNSSTEEVQIFVTDDFMCPESQSNVIDFRRAENIIATIESTSDVSCNQENAGPSEDGKVAFKIEGGVPNGINLLLESDNGKRIIYETNLNTSYVNNNLIPGLYSYRFTDITNGTYTPDQTFTIAEPDNLKIDSISTFPIACAEDKAAIKINTSNASVNYQYHDGNDWITSTSDSITGLTPSNLYFFKIKKGVCSSDSVSKTTATPPPQISITPSILNNTSCPSAYDGNAEISVSGGTMKTGNYLKSSLPGNFTWANENLLVGNSIGVGNYSFTITDGNGCKKTSSFEIGSVDIPLNINSILSTPNLCENRVSGGPSGAIQATIDPGDRPAPEYYYILREDNNDQDTVISTGSHVNFGNLAQSSNYSIYILDPLSGCNDEVDAEVGLNPNRLSWSDPATHTVNTVCEGQSTGTLSANARAGFIESTYSYRIQNGNGTDQNLNSPDSAIFTRLPEGNYTVTVQDDSTCFLTTSDYVDTDPTPIHFSISDIQDNYCDELDNGRFTITGSTSEGASVTSLKLFTDSVNANQFSWTNLREGNYPVSATDDQGCINDTTIYIDILNNDPQITYFILDSTACEEATNGRIQIGATQPIGFDEFVFRLGSDSLRDASSVEFTELIMGDYNLRVRDSMGCYSDTTIALRPIQLPTTIANFNPLNANCIRAADAGVHLEAIGSMSADPGFYFVLNEEDTITGNVADFKGYPVGGNNHVILYDKFGCTDRSNDFQFPVRADSLNIEITESIDASCPGYANGQIFATALNGNAAPSGFNFRILDESDGTEVAIFSGNPDASISTIPLGVYRVEVTDEDNCLALSEMVSIAEPSTPELVVNPGYVAQKGASSGWIDASMSGGNGKYLVEWYASETVDAVSMVMEETSTGISGITDLAAGNYLVRIQDTAGCAFWDDAWLEVLTEVREPEDSLKLELEEMTPVSCNGLSDGQFTLRATGGWGDTYFYGKAPNEIAAATPIFGGFAAGNGYTFYTVDSSGVVASAAFTMTEPEVLTSSIAGITDANCFGTEDGEVSLDITGGNNIYYVSADNTNWTEGDIVPGLAAGDYTIYVKDELDCATSIEATVNQPTELVLIDSSLKHTECQVNEGIISAEISGGIPAYNYFWYNGAELIDQGMSVTDSLYSGVYTLEVVDAHNCPQQFTFHISDLTDLEIAGITTDPVACWEGSDGSASAEILNGFPPYQIIWPDSSTATSVSGLQAGEYLLSVFDSEGCKVFESFTVGTPDSLWLNENTLQDALCLGVANGEIDITPMGGTPGYNVSWAHGPNRERIRNLDAGNYQIIVTDDHNCQRAFDFTLGYSDTLKSYLLENLVVCRDNVYPLDAGNYEYYAWYFNDHLESTDRVLDISSPGKYLLDVEDIRGCQTSDSIEVSNSETELGAQMLMASVVEQYDTVAIFEASVPAPDSIWLSKDESLVTIDSGQYWRHVIAQDTGRFEIKLVSYLSDCQDIIIKNLTVVPRSADTEGTKAAKRVIIGSATTFPNPNKGQFTLEVKLYQKQDISIRMVSYATGHTVEHRKAYGSDRYEEAFNLKNLLPGVYLLSVEAGDEMVTQKIVIQ